jgi:hypothetical protein
MTNKQKMALDFYNSELSRVKVGLTDYCPTLKVHANGNGEDTKHISLHKESAKILVKWLTEKFINK